MAYVKRHPIKATLFKALKYITDEKKTDEKILISSNKCSTDDKLANIEMNALKSIYHKEDKILGFHFVQSFKPGEIDYETAHQVGKEWADIFLSNHQYVFSTHVDKGHIHNHVIINSVGLDGKKYHSCINEREDIRAYSDVICRKYGLSIINNKYQNRTMSYKEWMENKNKTSWKQKTKEDIDYYISVSNGYEDFIKKMNNAGYGIKDKQSHNVMHMTFKHPEMKRQVRGKTLGADYTEDSIRKRIELKEYDIKTAVGKRYKYRTKKDKWNYVFKMVTFNHSSLKVNILLISILFELIFNKNENHQEHKRYYEAQKSIVNEVDKLSFSLYVIDKYNFKNRGDIDVAIEKVEQKIEDKKKLIEGMEKLYHKADAVCMEINFYRKYKKFYDEYSKSFVKGVYRKKNEYELEKFENSKAQLEKFGLHTEKDYENFEKQRDSVLEKVEVIRKQIYEDYKELEQIESLKDSLDNERRRKVISDVSLEEKTNNEKEKAK